MNAPAFFPVGKRYRLMRRPSESILPSSPRPARRDCHGRLITALLDTAGADCTVGESRLSAWASATFVGARHGLTVLLAGEDALIRAEALAAVLPETEFRLPGHIVADLAVDAVEETETGSASITLSILTIEAW